jgi:Xaa-Pro dipeptidase
MNRRVFLATAAAGLPRPAAAQPQEPAAIPDALKNLKPMLDGIHPITGDERGARVEKARKLMREHKLGAIFMEPGSSLYYYTGKRPDAGTFGWILTARGEPVWIHSEANAPYRQIVHALEDRGVASSRMGLEERVRFAVFDGLRKESPSLELTTADPVTAGCRVIKSPAELALMQRANDITIACYRAAFVTLREGMTQRELSANIAAGYRALGVTGNAMASFGKYTAFPHGSIQPQHLREGDLVLVDDGCTVEGYQSDITRTTVFGQPTKRQREIWELERKAQDAALAAAKPGATCESVDAAARQIITDFGFGPGYQVPGLPHRTGHGIGLDGHEWTYLVRGNKTRLEPGMCFSNEPTIAIYGEFGVRLEDCMYITEDGARMFSKQSPAIDRPFG